MNKNTDLKRLRRIAKDRNHLYYKYSHIGCPATGMEDNCVHPDLCADNGRCLDCFDLGPCLPNEDTEH